MIALPLLSLSLAALAAAKTTQTPQHCTGAIGAAASALKQFPYVVAACSSRFPVSTVHTTVTAAPVTSTFSATSISTSTLAAVTLTTTVTTQSIPQVVATESVTVFSTTVIVTETDVATITANANQKRGTTCTTLRTTTSSKSCSTPPKPSTTPIDDCLKSSLCACIESTPTTTFSITPTSSVTITIPSVVYTTPTTTLSVTAVQAVPTTLVVTVDTVTTTTATVTSTVTVAAASPTCDIEGYYVQAPFDYSASASDGTPAACEAYCEASTAGIAGSFGIVPGSECACYTASIGQAVTPGAGSGAYFYSISCNVATSRRDVASLDTRGLVSGNPLGIPVTSE